MQLEGALRCQPLIPSGFGAGLGKKGGHRDEHSERNRISAAIICHTTVDARSGRVGQPTIRTGWETCMQHDNSASSCHVRQLEGAAVYFSGLGMVPMYWAAAELLRRAYRVGGRWSGAAANLCCRQRPPASTAAACVILFQSEWHAPRHAHLPPGAQTGLQSQALETFAGRPKTQPLAVKRRYHSQQVDDICTHTATSQLMVTGMQVSVMSGRAGCVVKRRRGAGQHSTTHPSQKLIIMLRSAS